MKCSSVAAPRTRWWFFRGALVGRDVREAHVDIGKVRVLGGAYLRRGHEAPSGIVQERPREALPPRFQHGFESAAVEMRAQPALEEDGVPAAQEHGGAGNPHRGSLRNVLEEEVYREVGGGEPTTKLPHGPVKSISAPGWRAKR